VTSDGRAPQEAGLRRQVRGDVGRTHLGQLAEVSSRFRAAPLPGENRAREVARVGRRGVIGAAWLGGRAFAGRATIAGHGDTERTDFLTLARCSSKRSLGAAYSETRMRSPKAVSRSKSATRYRQGRPCVVASKTHSTPGRPRSSSISFSSRRV